MGKKPWQWSSDRITAGTLLASGRRPEEVPALLEADGHKLITERTLYNWLNEPEFKGFVEKAREEILLRLRSEVVAGSVRDKSVRIGYLDEMARRLMGAIDTRAVTMRGQEPGAESGLMVRNQDGSYSWDTTVIRELKSLLVEAAEQVGERGGEGEGSGKSLRIIL